MSTMNGVQCDSHFFKLEGGVDDYIKQCIHAFAFATGFAISDFILDFLIILLPVPKVGTSLTWPSILLLNLTLDLVVTDKY